MTQSDLANWITAISTAVTAVFAALAWRVGIQNDRRDRKRDLPVVELSVLSYRHTEFCDYAAMGLTVTNRLDETLFVEKVSIKAPKGGLISTGEYVVESDGSAYLAPPLTPQKTTSDSILVNTEISPRGETSQSGDGERFDQLDYRLFVAPPPGWRSGTIEIETLISSRAGTIRRKRIVTKCDITFPEQQKSAAKAADDLQITP
jgi:hypothetical protein